MFGTVLLSRIVAVYIRVDASHSYMLSVDIPFAAWLQNMRKGW